MGANAQTTVPTFTAGNVLTAAQMNQSARTGVPVFANTSDRDAAFGGTGEKTLAEGQLCYLEDANIVQYYDGASWATVGPDAPGLTLIKSQTIGSGVSSVTVSDVFSATYDNYRITINGGVGSTNLGLNLQLGATTTGYYQMIYRTSGYASTTQANAAVNNGSNFVDVGFGTTGQLSGFCDLLSPFLSSRTFFGGFSARASGESSGPTSGFLDNATSYTAFTFLVSPGNITGGTIRVYGYKN